MPTFVYLLQVFVSKGFSGKLSIAGASLPPPQPGLTRLKVADLTTFVRRGEFARQAGFAR